MSATLHVLLQAEHCLECNVADGAVELPACHQLGQVYQGVSDHPKVSQKANLKKNHMVLINHYGLY